MTLRAIIRRARPLLAASVATVAALAVAPGFQASADKRPAAPTRVILLDATGDMARRADGDAGDRFDLQRRALEAAMGGAPVDVSAAEGAELVGGRLALLGLARDDHHIAAGLHVLGCDAQPDPGRTAGDDRGLSVQT